MRLTTFTDFGLRALMRLAGDPERLFTSDEIATEFAISRHHLVKVIQELASAGFVVTQRGAGGGFRLALPAEKIRIGEVVRSLESRQALVECFRADGGACAHAEMPSEEPACEGRRSVFARTRRDDARRMRLSRQCSKKRVQEDGGVIAASLPDDLGWARPRARTRFSQGAC